MKQLTKPSSQNNIMHKHEFKCLESKNLKKKKKGNLKNRRRNDACKICGNYEHLNFLLLLRFFILLTNLQNASSLAPT